MSNLVGSSFSSLAVLLHKGIEKGAPGVLSQPKCIC